jgi:hypothetical protein
MCFNTVLIYTAIFNTQATGFITLISTIDRLISLLFPITHWKLTTRYAYAMISIPVLLNLPMFFIVGIQSYAKGDNYTLNFLTCNLVSSEMPTVLNYIRLVRAAASLIAVLLYIPILFKIYKVRYILYFNVV